MNFWNSTIFRARGWLYWGIAVLLSGALVACQAEAPSRITTVPTTATPIVVEATPTLSPTVPSTPLPTATEVLPTPTPSPVATLFAEGPWLLFELPTGSALTNIDGSGFTEISPLEAELLVTLPENLSANHEVAESVGEVGELRDIHLRNLHTGESRVIVSGPEDEAPLAWSPDGNYLLYTTAPYLPDTGTYPTGVWFYSLETEKSHFLYTPAPYAFEIAVIGWVEPHTALLKSYFFENGAADTQLVNMITGKAVPETHVTDPVREALNPHSGLLVWNDYFGLNPQEAEVNPPSEFNTFNFQTGESGTFSIHSEWGSLYWLEPASLFATNAATETHFFDDTGTIIFTLPCDCREWDLSASPDGAWIAGRVEGEWRIFDTRGALQGTLPGNSLYWLPSGEGVMLVSKDEAGSTTLYYATIDTWQLEVVPDSVWQGMEFVSIVAPPFSNP